MAASRRPGRRRERPRSFLGVAAVAILVVFPTAAGAQETSALRARDLGVPFEGTAGPLNSITDVAGVEVGHATLISGSGRLRPRMGPVRTGVTAVLPRGRSSTIPVFAGWFSFNGSGEMTGTTWLEERGLLDGPIMITNTHSVGTVRDATVAWMLRRGWNADWHTPVVAETWDGWLNDTNGFHVRETDVFKALDEARPGPVVEGNVGGGTGTQCNRFKGGIGTASRRLAGSDGGYTVGVLVQCNYGRRDILRIAGVPVGAELRSRHLPCYTLPEATPRLAFADCTSSERVQAESEGRVVADGSIIIVVATDAPLLPHQLMRLARRPALGLGRLGSVGHESSGDIFIAFSTGNPQLRSVEPGQGARTISMLPNEMLSALSEAVVQATEEAIVNAMVAARTLDGADGLRIAALPHGELRAILAHYRRLAEPARGRAPRVR